MSVSTKENLKNTEWLKVSQLKVGQKIAVCDPEVSDGAVWDEIVSIQSCGKEHVYDIEVDGTHNFVAGHVIDKESKKKFSEEEEKEILAENGHSDKLPDGLEFAGIVAHNTYIGGNLGVGTTTPGTLLSLGNTGASTINISATATSTFGAGINVRTGCFAVNGVCVGGGGSGSGTVGASTAIGQIPYYAAVGTTLTATSTLTISAKQFIGIGTSTPQAQLHLGTASTTMLSRFDKSAFIEGELEVLGSTYLGPMEFASDGGIISWIDMPVSTTVATSTPESYTARLGGADVLTIYGTAQGYLGGVANASTSVGIGTTSPYAKLSVVKLNPNPDERIFVIATSTSGVIFYVDEDGDVRYDGSASSPAADYAEYFYSDSTDLKPGELVCFDASKSNAVKRCAAGQSIGLIGVISEKPSLVGNSKDAYIGDPRYVIVGLLGQIKTFASAENGPILPGDNLTVATSTAGLAAKAIYGGEIIGTALESLSSATGTISVLVKSRWYSGTTAPSSIVLSGEISASGFINISTREMKKEISFLNNQDEDEILAKIASTSVATYLYNSDTDEQSCLGQTSGSILRSDLNSGPCKRLGLIAEEAPREVLSVDGRGVDIYKMTSFLFAGVKAQQRQIDKLTADVEAMKLKLNMNGGIGDPSARSGNTSGFFGFSSILDAFKQIGSVFENGLARFKKLFADNVETKKLAIDVTPDNVENTVKRDPTIGSGQILAGQKGVYIANNQISTSSKIFVTPEQPVAIGVCEKNNATTTSAQSVELPPGFEICLSDAAVKNISFNWWIIDAVDNSPASAEALAGGQPAIPSNGLSNQPIDNSSSTPILNPVIPFNSSSTPAVEPVPSQPAPVEQPAIQPSPEPAPAQPAPIVEPAPPAPAPAESPAPSEPVPGKAEAPPTPIAAPSAASSTNATSDAAQ